MIVIEQHEMATSVCRVYQIDLNEPGRVYRVGDLKPTLEAKANTMNSLSFLIIFNDE